MNDNIKDGPTSPDQPDESVLEDIAEATQVPAIPESGELPEEDDDNPYQDSDAALPDDLEEDVLSRDPSKEGGLFDEI